VQPFVAGDTLTKAIYPESERLAADLLTLPDVGRLIFEMASALDALHQSGLAFCHITPGDVILHGPDRRAMIVNWGAEVPREIDPEEEGGVMRNPRYTPPELIRGHPVDHRGDQYALATIAFEMLTRRHPFDDHNSTSEMLVSKLTSAPPSVCALRPDLPQGVADVVGRALSRAPIERFASITAFAVALSQMTSETLPPLPSHRRWWKSVISSLRSR
jgi:serine/threonine-protein kinase